MATYFWVGGAGNWDGTATSFASTSGGAGGAGIPGVADTVIIDANSGTTAFTVTVTAAYSIAALTINNANATLLHNATSTVGGTVTLTTGALNTNGQTCTWGQMLSSSTLARTLSLGASSITLTNTTSGTQWQIAGAGVMTFSAGTSTITANGGAGGNVLNTFAGGGFTYYNVVLGGQGAWTLNAPGNTFNNLSRIGVGSTDSLNFFANQTINGVFTVRGASPGQPVMVWDTTAVSTLSSTVTLTVNGSVSLTNAVFQNIIAAGTAIQPWTGTRIGNGGNTANIAFDAARTVYWVATAGGTWSATSSWANTSGGASGANPPLPQDTVIFDANSITSASRTITADSHVMGGNISFAAITNSPTLSMSQASTNVYIWGSLTFASGMTVGNQTNWFLMGYGASYTLTTSGKSFTSSTGTVEVAAINGTYVLQDDASFGGQLSVDMGTFDANGHNVTAVRFSSQGGNAHNTARTLKMGSGTWTMTGTGIVWSIASTSITLQAQTSTIVISDTSATSKTFTGGGLTWGNLSITGGGTGAVVIQGSNTFGTFSIGSPKTVQFTAGTTQTVSQFTAAGTAGSLITLQSTTAGTQWSLSRASGTNSSNYLSLQDGNATGGASWFAGANSTSVSNNTGWTFTAAAYASSVGVASGYAAAILAEPSLWAYWQLQETAGTVATDSGPNAYHGTYTGAPTLGTAGFGGRKALKCVGSGQYVSLPNHSLAAPYSLEGWMNWASIPNGQTGEQGVIINGGALNGSLGINRNTVSGLPTFQNFVPAAHPSGAGGQVYAPGTLGYGTKINEWYHLVVTCDALGNLTLYVNGVQVNAASGQATNAYQITALAQVASQTAMFSDVAVYSSALSAAQVAAHWAAAGDLAQSGENLSRLSTTGRPGSEPVNGQDGQVNTIGNPEENATGPTNISVWAGGFNGAVTANYGYADGPTPGLQTCYRYSTTMSSAYGIIASPTFGDSGSGYLNLAGLRNSGYLPVQPGQTVTIAYWMKVVSGFLTSGQVGGQFYFRDARGGWITNTSVNGPSYTTVNGQWGFVTVQATAPANAAWCGMYTATPPMPAGVVDVRWTGFVLTPGAVALTDSFDGGYNGGQWLGQAHNSYSVLPSIKRSTTPIRAIAETAHAIDTVTRLQAAKRTPSATSYASTVLADGPVAYWKLNETSGTTAADSAGARPGTYVGSYALGQRGPVASDQNAYGGDGATSGVTVPYNAALTTANWTVEAWIRPLSNGVMVVVGNTGLNRNSSQGFLLWTNSSALQLYVGNGATNSIGIAGVTLGGWHHVVATYDGTTVRLYINGTLVRSQALSGYVPNSSGPLSIGRWDVQGVDEWVGQIGQVALYSTALSATQIAAHYAARGDYVNSVSDLVARSTVIARNQTDTAGGQDVFYWMKPTRLPTSAQISAYSSAASISPLSTNSTPRRVRMLYPGQIHPGPTLFPGYVVSMTIASIARRASSVGIEGPSTQATILYGEP